jgi:hypothetical protein
MTQLLLRTAFSAVFKYSRCDLFVLMMAPFMEISEMPQASVEEVPS